MGKMDDAARKIDRYIAALAAECPAFPPDPRQERFFAAID
jgi:hypothetical protein